MDQKRPKSLTDSRVNQESSQQRIDPNHLHPHQSQLQPELQVQPQTQLQLQTQSQPELQPQQQPQPQTEPHQGPQTQSQQRLSSYVEDRFQQYQQQLVEYQLFVERQSGTQQQTELCREVHREGEAESELYGGTGVVVARKAPREPLNLSFLSQNIDLDHVNRKSDLKEERVRKLTSQFGGCDVVLLQDAFVFRSPFKMWGADLRLNLIQGGRRATMCYVACAEGPDVTPLFGQDSGLIVLSKYPVVSVHYQQFKAWDLLEIANSRGFIHSVLDLNHGRELHVINTSLDSKGKFNRLRQLEEISAYLSTCGVLATVEAQGGCDIERNVEVLVFGDFNLSQGDPIGELKAIRRILKPLQCLECIGRASVASETTSRHQHCFASQNVAANVQRWSRVDLGCAPTDGLSLSLLMV